MTSVTLTEKTYVNIRKDLISGKLKPGQKLISRTIASRHGVSLAPVREAIGRLAAEGLVEHIPGAGSFVRTMTKQDLYELYVLREALESCAAAEAAINAHPLQLQELEQLCLTFETLAQKIDGSDSVAQIMDQWIDAEERFHELLLEAARNSLLAKICGNYRTQLQIFELQRQQPFILSKAIADETVQMHQQIADAVKARDPVRARALMIEHIQIGKDNILAYFAKAPESLS
jgi:DNA-binding GntR family transcriptional regulator